MAGKRRSVKERDYQESLSSDRHLWEKEYKMDTSVKVRNFRQVQFPVNPNWGYQYYLKGVFENEKTGEMKTAEGFSAMQHAPNQGTIQLMVNEAIRKAQGQLGGSNWHLLRRIDSHMTLWRKLKRRTSGGKERKIPVVHPQNWKKVTSVKKTVKKTVPIKSANAPKAIPQLLKSRYEPIGGSQKHYRDRQTGDEITYREYRKRVEKGRKQGEV